MNTSNLHIFDKAKYHLEEVEKLGLPVHHAYHHTTFFFAWLIKNNLMNDDFESDFKNQFSQYKNSDITINRLYEIFGSCLISDMLSDRGNAFASAYFNFNHGKYLIDYHEYLRKALPTEFHVPYTSENEAIIHAVIDKRYEAWANAWPHQ